ncbi:hypothetical protein [Flagellimonas lutimaris]|uniref:hypothetical protein n=1 Tax=Flagellimonas lutimaris TaxID=475082 RepID=UPI003F5CDEE1
MIVTDLLWIEDDTEFVDGTLANFKEDREDLGFAIVPWHYVSKEEFDKDSHLELESLAIGLVCIDYNLPGGINGNEIIKIIRGYKANKEIPIIFYSAAKNESELKKILEETFDEEIDNIFYSTKDTLEDQIINVLS